MKQLQYDDAIDCGQNGDTCPMCGAHVVDEDATDRIKDSRIEVLYRFAERILWDEMSSKAIGTMLKIICAATLLPSASMRQIGAAVGCHHVTVVNTRKWLKENVPNIHSALWREK